MHGALLVTPGMGVGPEVTLRALAEEGHDGVVLVGRRGPLERANDGLGLPLVEANGLRPLAGALAVLDPGDGDEPAEVAAIRRSARACLAHEAAALVTGPIHKQKLMDRGFGFPGHTGFLGHLCGVADPVMGFVGDRLKVVLVTTHIPLSRVPSAVTAAEVCRVAEVGARALEQDLGIEQPRLVVCGLNPHAGEGGRLGTEEQTAIAPACRDLRQAGLSVEGPVSAESAFMTAWRGEADLVVAMYHDQALGPLKLAEFGRSVNWTLGIPIVRTSVDHGTADDLVGTGRADHSSMRAALRLARQIAARRG